MTIKDERFWALVEAAKQGADDPHNAIGRLAEWCVWLETQLIAIGERPATYDVVPGPGAPVKRKRRGKRRPVGEACEVGADDGPDDEAEAVTKTRQNPKRCAECGVRMYGFRPDARFCSTSCKMIAYRRNKRENRGRNE